MIKKEINEGRRKIKDTLKRWKNYIVPNPEEFDGQALEGREKYKSDYRIVGDSLSSHLDFRTVFDVGCAQGFLMEPLQEEGAEVQGIEVSEDVMEFLPNALKSQVSIGDFHEATGQYDLVCCVEVAEHIKPARSEELVDKLCELSERYIYFTAAPPGQPGHGHINCRPHEHWVNWFREREWMVDDQMTESLRQDLESIEHAQWLKGNSFIFLKE